MGSLRHRLQKKNIFPSLGAPNFSPIASIELVPFDYHTALCSTVVHTYQPGNFHQKKLFLRAACNLFSESLLLYMNLSLVILAGLCRRF